MADTRIDHQEISTATMRPATVTSEHKKGIEMLRRLQAKTQERQKHAPPIMARVLGETMKTLTLRTPEEEEVWLEREKRDKARRKEKEINENLQSLSALAGKRFAYGRVTLDNYTTPHQKQKDVVARLRTFLENVRERTVEGRGLIFLGSVGTGKDHLMFRRALSRGQTWDLREVDQRARPVRHIPRCHPGG